MKKLSLTINLKFKLLIEIVLSFILTLVYLYTFSLYVLAPYYQKNHNNLSASFVYYFAVIYIISALGVFVLCFFFMSNSHIKYIKYIAREIKLIANGNLGKTLEVRGRDELSELCKNINLMSKELKICLRMRENWKKQSQSL